MDVTKTFFAGNHGQPYFYNILQIGRLIQVIQMDDQQRAMGVQLFDLSSTSIKDVRFIYAQKDALEAKVPALEISQDNLQVATVTFFNQMKIARIIHQDDTGIVEEILLFNLKSQEEAQTFVRRLNELEMKNNTIVFRPYAY